MAKPQKEGIVIRTVETLGIAGLVAIIALTALQVALRYIVRKPLPWAEEIIRLISAWTIFLGSIVALKRASHVSVDYFVKMLPKKAERAVTLVGNVLILAFLAVVVRASVALMSEMWGTESSAAGYPVPLFFGAILVGSAGMFVEILIQTWTLIRGNGSKNDNSGTCGEVE